MPPSKRQRELRLLGSTLHAAGLLTGLALFTLAAWLVAAPLHKQRADYDSRGEKIHHLTSRRPYVERQHRELTDELAAVQRRKAELRGRITDGTREGEFLRQVSEVAADAGLHLVSFQPGAVSRKGQYGTLRIQVVLDGSFAGICRFLAGVDTLPRLSTVERLEVVAPIHGNAYSFKLTLEVYFARSGTVASSGKRKETRHG